MDNQHAPRWGRTVGLQVRAPQAVVRATVLHAIADEKRYRPGVNRLPVPSLALNGITCTAPANCYAVGTVVSGVRHKPLIEHWDGTNWAVMPSPSPAEYSTLLGISCAGPGSCIAVGRSFSAVNSLTLALRLSAGHWTITPTASPG